jgi:hypothetical protein
MPISSRIEADRKRVYAVLWGKVTLDEMVGAVNRSAAGFSAGDRFDILSDHTGLEKAIETDEARSLALHLETLQEHFAGALWAVVTKKKASYGMMRMLAVFLERIPVTLRVFYSHADAEDWLSSPATGGAD